MIWMTSLHGDNIILPEEDLRGEIAVLLENLPGRLDHGSISGADVLVQQSVELVVGAAVRAPGRPIILHVVKVDGGGSDHFGDLTAGLLQLHRFFVWGNLSYIFKRQKFKFTTLKKYWNKMLNLPWRQGTAHHWWRWRPKRKRREPRRISSFSFFSRFSCTLCCSRRTENLILTRSHDVFLY